MNRLKERRKELGLTQKQVAERAGLSWQVYQRYELGVRTPIATTTIKVARALETTVEALYGVVEDE